MSEEVFETGEGQARRGALLVGLLLAVTLHAFAELAIVTALPIISSELDGAMLYGVAFSAYLLTSLISIVWSGHMTDARGPLLPFVAGLAVFALGLIWAAASMTMWMFVIARAVQGLGGGAFSAVIYAGVNRGWKDHERAHIMALLSSAWIVPGLIAPAIAGAIAEFWDWRYIFLLLLPFVLITAVLSINGLKAMGAGDAEGTGWDKILDAGRLAVALTLVLAGITREPDLWSAVLIVSGPVLAWRPVIRFLPPGERRSRQVLLAALGIKFLLVFGFFGADTFLPLALIEIHGLTAFMAGIVLTAATLSWSGSAFLQSRWSKRISPRTLAVGGLTGITLSIGCLPLILIEGVAYWWSFVFWTMSGTAAGFAYNTVVTSAMAHTMKGKEGATSVATGLVEGISIALTAGIGGAILNQAERQGATMDLAIGSIWIISSLVTLTAVWVAWRYLEDKVRVEILEEGDLANASPHVSSVTSLSQD